MDRNYGQELRQPSSSSSLPDLNSRALDPFANGLGEISMAVLANPAKIQETIREVSNHEVPPAPGAAAAIATNNATNADILDDEKMNLSDVTRSADDILMEKMETAGFHSKPQARQQPEQANRAMSQPQQSHIDRFFNIPQPAPEIYDQAVDDDRFDDAAIDDPMYGGFDRPMPLAEQQPTDSLHARFTAPKSELDASGVHSPNTAANGPPPVNDNAAQSMAAAKTQSVHINTDRNVVNTFDNSIYATQAGTVSPGGGTTAVQGHRQRQQLQQQQKQRPRRDDEKSTGNSNSDGSSAADARGGGGASMTATESDATAYEYQMRERDRQRRKKEKRRRVRLPHERTYGEMQEERYEDWERKIQQDVKEAEDTEKRELLLLFAEKEQEGYKMLRQFNMSSNLNEMRFWYYKLLRDTRTDDEVAHLRSHLVEGTRILLYLNENVFSNPLGLADMVDFPDALASMLIGSWDRHIRDYVKSKNGLQGPPPQPLRNLGLNFLHLFISHHRKKAAEEQKEKAQREAAQREAMLAAAQRAGNVALNPFEAIFGERTNYMRGREGINPMELPPYANAATMPVPTHSAAEYAEFLQYKRAQEEAEYRAFLEHKRRGGASVATAAAAAPSQPTAFTAQQQQQPPQPQQQRQPQQPQRNKSTNTRAAPPSKPPQPPSSFLNDQLSRMRLGASPLPNDLGPPDVASIDASSSLSPTSSSIFRVPASQNSREQLAASSLHQNATAAASNSRLVGEKNASNRSTDRKSDDGKGKKTTANNDNDVSRSDTLLLSTSAEQAAATSLSSSSGDSVPTNRARRPPLPPSPTRRAPQVNGNALPRAYRTVDPGAKLLQSIGKRNGITDERLVPLPPVPDITRDHIKQLQERLARAKEQKEAERAKQVAQTQAKKPTDAAAKSTAPNKVGANLKTLRPVDRERVAKLLSVVPPRKASPQTDVPATPAKDKPAAPASQRRNDVASTSISEEHSSTGEYYQSDETSHATTEVESSSVASASSANGASDAAATPHAASDAGVVAPSGGKLPPATDYEALQAQIEAECDALGEDDDAITQYNDVKTVPKNATQMDSHKDDNRILDMLTMFQNFMSGPPKGTRPTAQTSMFSDIDGLMATTDNGENSGNGGEIKSWSKQKKSEKKSRRQRVVSSRRDAASDDVGHDEAAESGTGTRSDTSRSVNSREEKSSSTSFRVESANQSTAARLADSRGHMTW